jgi:hypothetical protein
VSNFGGMDDDEDHGFGQQMKTNSITRTLCGIVSVGELRNGCLSLEQAKDHYSKGNIQKLPQTYSIKGGQSKPKRDFATSPRCYHWFHSFTTSDSDGIQSYTLTLYQRGIDSRELPTMTLPNQTLTPGRWSQKCHDSTEPTLPPKTTEARVIP